MMESNHTQAVDRLITDRLEAIRAAIRDESISYGEIAELQSLGRHIDRDDMELLTWAYPLDEESGEPIVPPRSIHVEGRRWFDSTYGNTYHTVEVFVDDESIGIVPFSYGYGDAYMQSAAELLAGHEIAPVDIILWQWARDNGIELTNSVTDGRKRDLHLGGNR